MQLSGNFGRGAVDWRLSLALAVSLCAHLVLLLIELPQPYGAEHAEPLSVSLRPATPVATPVPPVPHIPPVAPRAPKPAHPDKPPQSAQDAMPLPLPEPKIAEDLSRRIYTGAAMGLAPKDSPPPPEGYAREDELDEPPSARDPVVPVFPPGALRERGSLRIVFELLISETGELVRARPVTVASPAVANASLAALKGARFEPAMRGGRPVAARIYYSFWYGIE